MASYSDLLKFLLMDYDDFTDTWGDKQNEEQIRAIEKALVGIDEVAISGSPQQLSDANMQASIIILTGVLTADHVILLAPRSRTFKVLNLCSGSYTVTVKAEVGDASGVVVTQNATVTMRYTGSVLTQMITTDFPVGTIIDWYGDAGNVPVGWAICDGTNGTPDLRNKIRIGAGDTYANGDTGGNASATTDSQGAHTHSLSTNTAGAHTHGGTTGGTSLTTAQLPAHSHKLFNTNTNTSGSTGEDHAAYAGHLTNRDDYIIRSHGSTPSKYDSANTGSGATHAHTISSDGGHTHTGTAASDGAHTHSVSTLQPFVAMFPIMRVGN
jgi:microcystin-dependent protein